VRAFTRTQSFGVLRVGLSMRRLDRALETVVRDVTFIALVLFGLGIVGGIVVARRIATPVRSLEQSASRMAGGDLTHRADVRRTDEIGALAGTFNRMAGTLEASFGKLEATLVSFERFVPSKFLRVVAPEGMEHIRVGERATRTITILFSDIRGYTSLSEQTTAEEMFELLNDYLARMGAEIDARGGFIDKYIGDAIMALFDDEYPDDALVACLGMRQSLEQWNVERAARGQPRVDTGIGLHRGEVIMGTVGYKSRIDSTVIGDAVNLASRVEGLTKNYDCAVLITEDVVVALRDKDRFVLRLVDAAAKVKGKDVPVRLYAVEGERDAASAA
jgi:adenylate cyclase